MDKHILETLRGLRLTLPSPLTPVGSYQTVTRSGEQLIVSGLGPFKDGRPVAGVVGADLSIDDANEAARLTMLLILGCVEDAVGLENVEQCLRLTVYMRAEPSFTQHPLVSDGASDLLLAIFGRERLPARTSLGVHTLPMGLALEIDSVFQLKRAAPG